MKKIKKSVDIGLDVLCIVNKSPCIPMTAHAISHVCGCTGANIQAIEKRALRKIKLTNQYLFDYIDVELE